MSSRDIQMIREDGFYWVNIAHEWTIAEWNFGTKKWISIIGFREDEYADDFFDEIDERKIERIMS